MPAAQIGGGLRYAVTDRVSVDLGYRYRLAVNPQISNVFVQPVSGDTMIGIGSHQHGTIGVHVVQLGLTFALQ